jgi:hypothetical protein
MSSKGSYQSTKKSGALKGRPVEPTEVDEFDEINEVTYDGDDGDDESRVTLEVRTNSGESFREFLSDTFGEETPEEVGLPPPPPIQTITTSEGTKIKVDEEVSLPDGVLPSLGWVKRNFKTKSAAIRYLLSRQCSVKDISKLLDVKYQHVRNVKHTKLKRGPNEDWNLERRRISEGIKDGEDGEW